MHPESSTAFIWEQCAANQVMACVGVVGYALNRSDCNLG